MKEFHVNFNIDLKVKEVIQKCIGIVGDLNAFDRVYLVFHLVILKKYYDKIKRQLFQWA